ncbi:unnamed protein product, partial [marine sediment metagenome]
NIASKTEIKNWRNTLERDSNNNQFYACVNMV